jgi:Domain of unknown function (DUF6362)
MTAIRWTPSQVEERLVEAAAILRCLPEQQIRGYFNTWPKMVYEFGDLIGQEMPRLKRSWPAPDAISRMEATLTWTIGLDQVDAKIVWLRASGVRWKVVCGTVGLARAACHEHWLYALCLIAVRLSGRRLPRNCSRRRVIAEVRAAN